MDGGPAERERGITCGKAVWGGRGGGRVGAGGFSVNQQTKTRNEIVSPLIIKTTNFCRDRVLGVVIGI